MKSKEILTSLESLLISIYSFLFFSHIWPFSIFFIFQDRDLERAKQLAEGSLIFFGPEMIGGGNLPGGFYYYLLSIPYLLGLDWSACWHLMIILLSVGIGLAWMFIVSVFGYLNAIVFITLIFNSTALMIVEGIFQNPSYLPFFTICSVIGLCLTFSDISVSKNMYWIATCFLLGLSIQIHFTAFFILLSGVSLQLIARRLKINQLNYRYFFIGLIIFTLTLLPYYISKLLSNYGIITGQKVPLGSGSDMKAPLFFLNRILFNLSMINVEQIWNNLFLQLQPEILLSLFIIPAGYLAYSHMLHKNRIETEKEVKYQLFRILAIIFVFNVIPHLLFFIFDFTFSIYYTTNAIFVIAFIASVMPINVLNEGQKEKYYYLTFACILIIAIYKFWNGPQVDFKAMFKISMIYYVLIFMMLALVMIVKKVKYSTIAMVLFMLLLPNISLKYNLRLPGEMENLWLPKFINAENINNICKHIIKETCWDFETARKKIMRMNIHSEMGFRQLYNDEYKRIVHCESSKNPDGYIITTLDSTEDKTILETSPHEWLSSKRPYHVIHDYMINNNLRMRNPVIFDNTVLLEYDLKNPETGQSSSIQNIGYSYEENEFDHYFKKYPAGISIIEKGKYFIHWNNSPEHEDQCPIGYLLDLNGLAAMRNTIKVSIIGPSLASPSIFVNPDCSAMLNLPYVIFECNGKKYKKNLVRQLGDIFGETADSNFISAPFETHVINPCKDDTCQITVGWDSLVISSFSKGKMHIPDLPITIYDIKKHP